MHRWHVGRSNAPSHPHKNLFWRHLEPRGSGQDKDFWKEASSACFCDIPDIRAEIPARLLLTKLGGKDTHLFTKCVTLETFLNSSKTKMIVLFWGAPLSVMVPCWYFKSIDQAAPVWTGQQGTGHDTVIRGEKQWWTDPHYPISFNSARLYISFASRAYHFDAKKNKTKNKSY